MDAYQLIFFSAEWGRRGLGIGSWELGKKGVGGWELGVGEEEEGGRRELGVGEEEEGGGS
uniref:Uncharacterized protein n=1 Tax=Desertifilum tharense IPPAS B-1220 TaxID=1781255 RepID=A0A1E5QD58_9CYAN|nr:hypothetical protein BH720_24085 [Desertifilum tharense IPPAS B-1220]